VQFTDYSGVCSGNVIDTWSWDFGDGTSSNEQHPLHIYTNEGSYNVTLTVTTASMLVRTITMNVNVVNPVPLVVNLGGDTYFCENSSIQLQTGISGAAYAWSTGETTSSININTAGTYWVTVTKDNCIATDTIQVGMNPALTTAFSYTFETVCLPVTVRFRDSTLACNANIASWLWDFGDGTSSDAQHPVHTYTTNGTYTVTLIVNTTNGGADIVSKNIFISSSMFTVNLGADTTVCTGNTHTLDAGNPGAQYVWNTGETTRSIAVNDGGIYWVRAERNGCITSDTIVVRNTLPVTAKIGMSIPAKCLPVPVQFADSSLIHCGEAINDWKWEFGDGSVSNEQHPNHVYTIEGTYLVKLTMTASNGVTISTSREVKIENHKPILNLGADLTVCKGTTVPLDAGITGAVYSWSPATGMNDATIRNPVVQPQVTTIYSVTVTKCNYTQTDEIKVIVDSIRKPIIIQDNNMLKATAADAYQWYKDNQSITGATARTYHAKSLGFYSVKVGSGRGCENMSDPFLYIPKHKNGKGLNGISIHCSPNPSNGLVNLVLDAQPEKPIKLAIIDRYGKAIMRMNITQQYNQLRLYMLPKGQYFFELKMGNEMIVIPVVIQ
jgi:PKD repeat protein